MEIYKQGWESIVKPQSFPYDEFDLGPKVQTSRFNPDITIKRYDFDTVNSASSTLKCSFFHTKIEEDERLALLKSRKERFDHSEKPCIIYCHSHSANRVEGVSIIHQALPDFNVCIFDFSGCGQSEGEFVTLGIKESDDIKSVMTFLEIEMNVRNFFLWGRSMGAVSCLLMLAHQEEEMTQEELEFSRFGDTKVIHACAYDSPFTDAKEMVTFL